jgi:hypothetical protein
LQRLESNASAFAAIEFLVEKNTANQAKDREDEK